MSEAPLILGVSGLRGIVGESLTPEVAARYAGAFGAWLKAKWGWAEEVVVARDGRAGGDAVYHSVISGLSSAGMHVRAIDVATTPTAGLALGAAAGAIVVTASHNPGEWNGLKCLVLFDEGDVGGRAPSQAEAEEIIARFRGSDSSADSPAGSVDHVGNDEAIDYHVAICNSRYRACVGDGPGELAAQEFCAVLDSVNASGAQAAEALLGEIGARAVQLFGDGSGVFPHPPEPTRENLSGRGGLCDAVPGLKADVGFAQDPDADRLAIVDELGSYIGEEYTLVLAAASLLEARDSSRLEAGSTKTGPVIVTNLSTSRMIDDVAAHYGSRVVRTAVGEANVVERMKALKEQGEDVVLGGEGNGGVIWPEVVYVRDSLGAMALTLALMARTGKKVSELVSWIDSMAGEGGGGYAIVKRKVDIPTKEAAAPAIEAVRKACEGESGAVVDLQDGVRVDWPGQRAWAHVRASNTEPIMRLIGEAPSEAEAEALLARVEAMIAGG